MNTNLTATIRLRVPQQTDRATETIRPWRRVSVPGKTARVQYSGPRRLTSRVCHQLSGSVAGQWAYGAEPADVVDQQIDRPLWRRRW